MVIRLKLPVRERLTLDSQLRRLVIMEQELKALDGQSADSIAASAKSIVPQRKPAQQPSLWQQNRPPSWAAELVFFRYAAPITDDRGHYADPGIFEAWLGVRLRQKAAPEGLLQGCLRFGAPSIRVDGI